MVRQFCKGCATCAVTATSSKPPAGTKPIVAKSFLNRIQMDLVEMKAFQGGLHEAFQDISKKSKQSLKEIGNCDYVSLVPENALPSYICNIADHASKVGKSYAVANKKPESVALCLLDFISTYGVPAVSKLLFICYLFLTPIANQFLIISITPLKIIHTDNGKEFIKMCFDSKYKGARFDHLTDEEFWQTQTIVSDWYAYDFSIKEIIYLHFLLTSYEK